ncbi:MAG TPA: efflux RND transporter periplasmic adaptor subunit [Verrucomicrobiae bacterium]|nr:efflux RND transporter periplasmic adaptor subunit [Verrucomicrobiae bacterium]
MKKKWKILLIIGLVVVVGGGVFASIRYNQRGIVAVQTGRVVRQDLTSLVTASGEIKPKNYYNLGANAMGPLTAINVKEGDQVRKGEVLAQIEAIQSKADVEAQKAQIQTSLADSAAAEAGAKAMQDAIATAQAGLEKANAELERTKLNLDREAQLYKDKLVAKQDYDQKKAEYDTAVAGILDANTRIAQAKSQEAQSRAQLVSAQRHVTQAQANLTRVVDVFDKYSVISPIDGVVTNLPVRIGETVVPGIQSSTASTVMTVADMSLITAEVKVDETDIVNVQLNQKAALTIDAIPDKTFHGHVIEIGNTAIVRSTGVAASQSQTSSQEAKDFKVVIAMDDPPDDVRPGLSCTAKITTATRSNALTVPIQALTIRQKGDLEQQKKTGGVQAATKLTPAEEKARKQEIQGVFVIANGKAEFRKVDTGITGATDIEVLGGLKEGDEIVTGSYSVIRTLRNEAKVKVDNKAPVKVEAT